MQLCVFQANIVNPRYIPQLTTESLSLMLNTVGTLRHITILAFDQVGYKLEHFINSCISVQYCHIFYLAVRFNVPNFVFRVFSSLLC